MALHLQEISEQHSGDPLSKEIKIDSYVNKSSDKDALTYIVEDDKANNFLCKMTLEEAGITNTRSFLRAELALADLKAMHERNEAFPSLILLDINMPAMDGWAFLNAFREFPNEAKVNTCVLLFSSSDHPRDIEKAKYYPEVLDFIVKPMSEEVANSLKEKYFRANLAA